MLGSIGAIGGLLLIGIGPLPLCWALLTNAQPPGAAHHVAHQLLSGALLWCGLQMSLATLLAALGTFRLEPVLMTEGALLLLGILLAYSSWTLAVSRRSSLQYQPIEPRMDWYATALLLWLPPLTAAFTVLILFGNLTSQPITDYDSLYYHLPFIAALHSTGGLSTPAVPAIVAWYPYGWETLCALFVLPFGEDLVVALPNLLAWTILGMAIYLLAQRGSESSPLAAMVALLALTQPLVLDQINTIRVDLALAAFFAAGLYFTLHTPRGLAGLSPLLALLSAGLIVALKTTGLLYAALLVAILLLQWAITRPVTDHNLSGPPYATAPLKRGATAAIMLLTLGSAGYWYGRNWQLYGNPLGLLEVKLGGWVLWPGPLAAAALRGSTLAALFAPDNPSHWESLLQQAWTQLALPGVILAGLLLLMLYMRFFHRREQHVSSPLAWGILGLMLLLFAIFWITPFGGDDGTNNWRFTDAWFGQSLRFALPALALLAVCAAWGAARLSRMAMPLTVAGIACVLLTLAQRSTLYLAAVIAFSGGLLVLSWLWPRFQQMAWAKSEFLQRRGPVTLTILFCLGCLLTLAPLQSLRTNRRPLVYGQLPQVVEEVAPPQTVIAALFSHQSYLAAGPHLQRTVVQAPTTFATPQQLLGWLNTHTIELIVVGPIRPEWQAEPLLRWLATDGSTVELLYNEGPTDPALYRVRQP